MSLNGLYKKFSLKIKIIVFCILSIVVVLIAAHKIIYNRQHISRSSGYDYSRHNNEVIKESSSISKLQDEKNKKLEKEYKEAENMFRQKKYSDSIEKANGIINEDSNFYKAYNIKGIALGYSNNYEDGIKNIDKALSIRPDYGYARFNKALIYELYGKYDDALIWYDKDLEIENYVWSYYGKASIYGRRGDVENTVKYLGAALKISPEIKDIAREEKDFDPVKSSRKFQDLVK